MEIREFVEYYKHKGLTIEDIYFLYYFKIYKTTTPILSEVMDNISSFYYMKNENNESLVTILLEDKTKQLEELKSTIEISGGKEFKKLISKNDKKRYKENI